jgi:hypothetical protein
MTNYVREITTGICKCPTATHDELTVDSAGIQVKKMFSKMFWRYTSKRF